MTPKEINRAVAEYVGELRNYHADLNAIHEARKVLTVNQQHRYAEELGRIIFEGELCVPDFRDNWYMAYMMVAATAPQHCEGFLRAIGKWRDSDTAEPA